MQNWTKSIFEDTRPYLMHNWPNGWVKQVLIHLWWKRQIVVDLVRNGSNLNCNCLIVCSLFFPKIISWYITIYFIRDAPIVLQDSTHRYKWSSLPFWLHFETSIKNSKKIKKLEKPSHCVIIYDQVSRKNNKLVIRKFI